MILDKNNFTINSFSLINYVFCFFPFSFIFGNLITNINLVLFCVLGIFCLRSRILNNKFNFPIKIIFLFFLVVLFSTCLSFIKSLYFGEYEFNDFIKLIKSILFFRFFIMLIIVYFISQLDIINFKHFFIAAAFSSLLISVDVFYQYIFGFNIIGLESYIHHNTSFFGDELISGGFIQNFSFFSILFLVYVFRNNYYLRIISTTAAISILGLGIIISGNRMPFFLFLFGLLLVFFFSKQLRIILLISFLILCTNVGFLMSYDNKIKENYVSFFGNSKYIVIRSIERIKNDPSEIILMEEEEFKDPTERDAYGKLIFTAVEVWKLQKIFGNGIKSFRKDCVKFVHENERGTCSIHPHNYYLEILTDLGIIGFISAMAIALIFIVFLAKNYRILNGNKVQNLFLLAATISLFLGVFPIKSTGSIFTTNNATYIILVSAIVLCHKRLLEGKNFS